MINKLKKAVMKAKLEKDVLKNNLISTLIGEAQMVGKNDGNRETTDSEVINIIRKFLKNTTENIELLKEMGKDAGNALREKEILESFLPKQLSSDELINIIDKIVASLPEKSVKMMGVVMSELKNKHDGLFDGRTASELVKKSLLNK